MNQRRSWPLRPGLASLSRVAGLALTLALGSAALGRAQSPRAGEYEVKAAFLFHFVQFVQWPPSSSDTICVGIVGDDPFGPILDQMVKGEAVQGRSLVVRRATQVEGLGTCEVIFIGRSQKARIGDILSVLKDAPTLTVGEVDGFARQGGIINFFLEGKKIRFEINPVAARRRGLKVSSQLLTLGKIVDIDPQSED